MKAIFLLLLSTLMLFGGMLRSEVSAVGENNITIETEGVEVGMSGFVVHRLAPGRSTILNRVSVVSVDKEHKTAKLRLLPFDLFESNNLPRIKMKPKVGDSVLLAYAYERGLLIAPSESIYYTLTRAMKTETFVHPDVFATLLSYKGHPTPLQKDFEGFCNDVTLGLLFFYIEQKLYTVDCHSFAILGIQDAPLKQEKQKLPFYTRVKKIEANWFGEGSDELEDYEPYYYGLLYRNNPNNEALLQNMKASSDANVTQLLHELNIEETK